MLITTKNCPNLTPDDTYANIVPGLAKALKDIDEIKGIDVEGVRRRTVTSKIMKRVHHFLKMNEGDSMINFDDIITYLDVSFVNIPALHIMYKGVTGEDLPPIVVESYMMTKFVKEGRRSLHVDERTFFKKKYNANSYFMRQPSFSGSSVVEIEDMWKYHKESSFDTDFSDLINYIVDKGDVVSLDDDYVISTGAYFGEKYILDNVNTKCEPLISNTKDVIVGTKFSDEQKDSVERILTSDRKFDVLTGPAGSGKSLVISEIVNNAKRFKKNIVCCAFTGKASSRMEQSEISISKLVFPPSTIHSLIAKLKFTEKDTTDIDIVIIDESSTVNSELFNMFIETLQHTATFNKIKFLLVGDMHQLPPIGGGIIFEDIITQKLYPVHKLTKIFRTTDPSMLKLYNDVLSSNNLNINNHKKFFKLYNDDNIEEVLHKVVDILFDKDPTWYKDNKCMILAHTNKYINYINYLCYKKLNHGREIDFYEHIFTGNDDYDWKELPVYWRGAKILFTKNDKIDLDKNKSVIRVTNGTVGEIVDFLDDLVLVKSYDDGRTFYIEGDYSDIKLAYAMTVYKSQGSEAQYVMYFHSNNIFETKRLAYTAMTRARNNVKIYTPSNGFKMSKDVARITSINS